ncbi:cyclase family protein [Paenibacillus sp. P96]|uniref:Cyclase family protein n=1 Tax=Paenibacillus zeirhizosphaerae TaxID=2987519 RepID=A0ABT9FLE2_9BACL|nr:cyclase family protein [Paenibacillus sp. P96]MDP4095554.1 cyclase family protein [Paenibacillus sp. P96]
MIIDLTHLIEDGMPPYPGDTATVLRHSSELQTDHYNNHQLTINMHAGTHIDGPMHLLNVKEYLNEFPLERFIGEGVVIDVSGEKEILYKEEYEGIIEKDQIVLIHTGYSKFFGQPKYFADHPVMTLAFAELLVRKQVKMVGLDMPSPDKYPFEVHKHLFSHKILIAENLTNVGKLDEFEVIALPLYIKADSSIARVIARVK